MTKQNTTIQSKNTKKQNAGNVIIGLGLLLAVLSIAYSTTVIAIGTDGLTPKILLIPQVLLGSWIAVKKFINKGE